jgi:transcriptional regulator GlxA family with amidase domain
MKTIHILIYEDAVLSAVSGVLDLFSRASTLMQLKKKTKGAFKIELIGEKLKNIQLSLPAQFICSKTIAETNSPGLVIVPPFSINVDEALSKNEGITNWLRTLDLRKTEVASLCRGSYFLAEAALLDGREATSHWMSTDDMQRRYPQVKILPDVVITDYKGIYTSGGAFSSLNLVLYLIEKFCGPEIAIQLSKEFSIDMDRVTQAYFAVFQGQRNHKDEQIHKAQSFIERNYNREISVEKIALHTNMSKRNFIRRFKDATRNNPLEYLQRVKIESAKRSIEKGQSNINSVMYDAGYNDIKTFRSIFKRITGITPQDYVRKYTGLKSIK